MLDVYGFDVLSMSFFWEYWKPEQFEWARKRYLATERKRI